MAMAACFAVHFFKSPFLKKSTLTSLPSTYLYLPCPTPPCPPCVSASQDAVNKAQAGDVILVRAGVYVEQVRVSTPNITLIGEGQGVTIVKCNRSKAGGYSIDQSPTLGE